MKMNITTLLILVAAVSCAGNYRPSETIEAKMARYESSKKLVNVVPDLPVGQVSASSRRPASAEDEVTINMEKKSSKRLYFSTLFTQYEYLKNIELKENAPEIMHCPHFHSSVVEIREMNTGTQSKTKIDWKNRFQGDWKLLSAQYPELNLPIDDYQQYPKVSDVMSDPEISKKYGDQINDVMERALSLHVYKTYRELSELCEIGTSDNYYSYENLLGHLEKHAESRTPESSNMKTLFKTTVFSNMALIQSLSQAKGTHRGPASADANHEASYHQALMKRFKVEWVGDYMKTIK